MKNIRQLFDEHLRKCEGVVGGRIDISLRPTVDLGSPVTMPYLSGSTTSKTWVRNRLASIYFKKILVGTFAVFRDSIPQSTSKQSYSHSNGAKIGVYKFQEGSELSLFYIIAWRINSVKFYDRIFSLQMFILNH